MEHETFIMDLDSINSYGVATTNYKLTFVVKIHMLHQSQIMEKIEVGLYKFRNLLIRYNETLTQTRRNSNCKMFEKVDCDQI